MKIGHLLLLAVIGLGGCYYPETFRFVQLNTQNPVGAARRIQAASPAFDGATINGRPINTFRGQLAPPQRDSFDQDLIGFSGEYASNLQRLLKQEGGVGDLLLTDAPGPGVFVLRVLLTSIDIGSWTGTHPASADYLVEVRAPDGSLVESYSARTLINIGWSSGERLRYLGAQISRNVSRYLRARHRGLTGDQR
jgi:hypothetical protein